MNCVSSRWSRSPNAPDVDPLVVELPERPDDDDDEAAAARAAAVVVAWSAASVSG